MIRSSNESVKVGLNFCKTQVGGRIENIVSKVWANWTCKKYKCSIIYLTETSHEKYIEKCWKNVIVNNGKSKKTMFRSETSPVDHMATVKAQRRRSVKWKLKAEIKTGCVHVKHCVHCNLWKHEAHTETRVQTEENSWTRRWNTICLFSSYTAAEKRQNDLWVQINNVDVMCHNMPDVGLVLCRALFWRCVKIPTCSTEWSSDQILLELHMKGFLCSLAPEAGGKQLDTHWVVTTKMKDVVPESTAQINTLNVCFSPHLLHDPGVVVVFEREYGKTKLFVREAVSKRVPHRRVTVGQAGVVRLRVQTWKDTLINFRVHFHRTFFTLTFFP